MSQTQIGEVLMRHGRYVRPFPEGGAASGALARMAAAYSTLVSVADAGVERTTAIRKDANLSPQGRQAAISDWLGKSGAQDALRAGRDALIAVEGELRGLREKASGPAIDKTDVAAAMLRWRWADRLAAMDPLERGSRLRTGDLPAEAVSAILEAPELAGVTPAQADRLRAHILATERPEDAA